MTSAALVLLMTPGLALFYGGMVRSKSVLNMIMMSFSAMGVITVVWVLVGFSLAFGKDTGLGLIGDFGDIGLTNALTTAVGPEGHQIPMLAFVMFQLTFAIVTTALLSGAIADRTRFSSWIVFMIVWALLVYVPLAHWAFALQGGTGGWISDRLGALDFAGGTVVEINSGASALALALVVGRRIGFRHDPMRPHNLPLVLLGAGLLWFGWLGFNAGSALSASGLASTALINTQIATACGALTWIAFERLRDGRATTLGVASGAVAGAVAITPACGFVTPLGAMAIGLAAGMICAWAVHQKFRFGFDDSLDVVGVHGVGGFVGMLGIGLFAALIANSAGADGLFFGGGAQLLGKQVIASLATAAYAFVVTWIIAKVIMKTIGFRAHPDDEIAGLDTTLHAESAYDLAGVAGGGSIGAGHPLRDLIGRSREEDE
ncbi:MAG: ammonium transporter, partial [Candidatus Nanopelagicales bacterium]|nr:ammonium transporter [Candidatus Nanopelagicales bacterium]